MSFCLNTLLTDIATRYPVSREKIIEAQIKCLSKLSNMIRSAKSDKLNDITKSMFLLSDIIYLLIFIKSFKLLITKIMLDMSYLIILGIIQNLKRI